MMVVSLPPSGNMATLRYWLPHTATQYICFVATFSLLLLITGTVWSDLPGHQLPFGKSGKNVLVDSVAGFPAIEDFLDNYAAENKPLLMSGAIRRSRAVQRWTDEYLGDLVDREPHSVWVEPMKKEIRGTNGYYMSFSRFLNVYNTSLIYTVDDIPPPMKSDVPMPCPLQCPSLTDNLLQNIMWFSSGGTKSVVHTDDYENILCSVRGAKHLTMVDPSYGLHKFPFRRDGSMPVDVDSVDVNKFPIFSKVKFVIARLSPGDCLYIPEMWIHQVNSYGSNIGINFWWSRDTTEDILHSGECHTHESCDPEFYVGNITKYNLVQEDDLDFCYPANFLKYECLPSEIMHIQ